MTSERLFNSFIPPQKNCTPPKKKKFWLRPCSKYCAMHIFSCTQGGSTYRQELERFPRPPQIAACSRTAQGVSPALGPLEPEAQHTGPTNGVGAADEKSGRRRPIRRRRKSPPLLLLMLLIIMMRMRMRMVRLTLATSGNRIFINRSAGVGNHKRRPIKSRQLMWRRRSRVHCVRGRPQRT